MSTSQSITIKEIVDELDAARHEYEEKQAVLRKKLHDMFDCGPESSQRQIVRDLIDMFLFPSD